MTMTRLTDRATIFAGLAVVVLAAAILLGMGRDRRHQKRKRTNDRGGRSPLPVSTHLFLPSSG